MSQTLSNFFLRKGNRRQIPDFMYTLRGLNMVEPDQTIDSNGRTYGQTPYTINSRMKAQDTEPRTAIASRKGIGFYTIPVGEALNDSQTVTTGQGAHDVSYLSRVAQTFTPSATKRLTAIDLLLKTNTSNDVVMIAIHENNSGALGTRVAISSIQKQDVSGNYTYVRARFPQAPLLTAGTTYWFVVYSQDPAAAGTYYLSYSTVNYGSNMTSIDGGVTWTPFIGSYNYKIYLSDDAPVLWHTRYVKNDGTKQTIFATGGATPALWQVTNEATGAVMQILGGLSPNATRYRKAVINGVLYIVNGYDNIIKWNGSAISRIANDPSLFPVPCNIVVHKNRVFYYNKDNPTRVYFSNLATDYDTIPSVNFFYVPDPSSPDAITGWVVWEGQLVIFTAETKWHLIGNDLASFDLVQTPGGLKGAVSQEAIARSEKVIYFYSIDGGPHYYDGSRDMPIGDIIQPETNGIINPETIDTILTDREWRIYYKHLGDSNHKRMLLFDMKYGEWFLDTETYTRYPATRSLEANELVEASSVVGALYMAEVQDAHLGAPIDWKYWTNYKKYLSGIAKDRIRTFRAVFEAPDRTYSVLVGKDADFDNSPAMKTVTLNTTGITYDGGETYGDPTATYGLGTSVAQPKVSLSGRANNTQYRFEKYGAYTPVRLYGYEGIILSGRPR